jgi:2-hydroxy fatty acid dioxygenase
VQVAEAWRWAVMLNALSWYMQIHPGHMVCEKSRPALMDSLVQAFLTAPLFVWLDLLFALGYRRDLQVAIDSHVAAKKAEKAAKAE